MKLRNKKAMWRSVGVGVASMTMLLSFQNCGKAGFDGATEELSSSTSDATLSAKYGDSTASKVSAIPFAFDATFDQIAYNSCARDGLKGAKGYFTLSAGAFGDFGGGVRVKDSFFSYADANFKPIHPETSLTQNQYREYLADSPENAGARPVLAVRQSNSLTTIVYPNANGASATLGLDFKHMLTTLTDSLMMASLTQRGTVASYLPFSSEQKILQGDIVFNDWEGTAQDFRDVLMGSAVLTVGYTKATGEAFEMRGPAAAVSTYPVKKAYGRSYKLEFGNVPAPYSDNTIATNPNNILTSIWESDLENPSAAGQQWSCDYNRRYMVVRNLDAALYCPQEDAGMLSDANYRRELAIVRRHLRADQWDVNITKRCVVPKAGTTTACYKEEPVGGKVAGVVYDRTKECFQKNKETSSYLGSTIPVDKCPQFVSICTRY